MAAKWQGLRAQGHRGHRSGRPRGTLSCCRLGHRTPCSLLKLRSQLKESLHRRREGRDCRGSNNWRRRCHGWAGGRGPSWCNHWHRSSGPAREWRIWQGRARGPNLKAGTRWAGGHCGSPHSGRGCRRIKCLGVRDRGPSDRGSVWGSQKRGWPPFPPNLWKGGLQEQQPVGPLRRRKQRQLQKQQCQGRLPAHQRADQTPWLQRQLPSSCPHRSCRRP